MKLTRSDICGKLHYASMMCEKFHEQREAIHWALQQARKRYEEANSMKDIPGQIHAAEWASEAERMSNFMDSLDEIKDKVVREWDNWAQISQKYELMLERGNFNE